MTISNWAGNVQFTADHVERPESVEQVQELIAASPRVRALGSGHSFNRIADTDGVLLSVAALPLDITVDAAARTVEVSASARYGELTTALHAEGFALPNLGSLPHITVAGASATGTHGSGDGNGCLASAVVGIQFVRADGELVEVSHGDPTFPGSVLALGSLGIVTRLTLAVEPSYDVRQDVWIDAPLPGVLERLDEIMASGYSVSMFRDARPDVVAQIWVKSRVGADLADGAAWGAKPAAIAMHPVPGIDPAPATQQMGVPGPWHERLPHFRLSHTPSSGSEQQSEWMVGRENGAAALRAVSELDLGPVLQVAEVRSIAADELWLSPFYRRDTLALHFTWFDDDAQVAEAVGKIERALEPFEARPHWGKVFQVPPRPERLPDFVKLMAEHDPNGKFRNDFIERYVTG